MSDKIDQRIVEMSFENHKFEEGILKSKNSLNDFSNTLKNMETGKDFSGLDRSVQSISSSFSVLEQVGIGALRRVGEAAVNAGANIVKSLSITPIMQGFNEMELKMNSTQTIMASTGETLATVNQYLQELNDYSDRTIYSFADMTQNIGKFTNAGVKLDMAVASIKGISNAAALAGANSNEASRAMYNFAQALSAGYVKLIDWKSIELANMATVEFKQHLLDMAVAAGTVSKSADGMYKVLTKDMTGKVMDGTISATRNFNESLNYQWMTTDALTRTLAEYADETTEIGKRAAKAATQVTTFSKLMDTLKESVGSGWAQTFEIIFGDFNEARDLWSGMNDVLGSTINTLSDARNTLLSGGLGSGWKQFLKEGISDASAFSDTLAVVAGEAGVDIDNIVKSAGSMEKAVKGNWITGKMLTDTVSRMSDKIKNLSGEELKNAGYTEKTKAELLALRDAILSGSISADDFAAKMAKMSGRENIIQGLKNSVIALLTALKPISKAFDQIFPPMTITRLYNITEMFKNFTQSLIITDETANKIKRTFAGFFAVIDIGWTVVKFLGSSLLEVVGALIPISGGFLDITASIGDFLVIVDRVIKTSGAFQYGLLAIKIGAVITRNALISIIETISDFANGLWSANKPLEYIGSLIQTVFGSIVDSIKMGISWISGGFINALSKASDVIDNMIGKNTSSVLSNILSILKEFVDLIVNKATGGLKNFGDVIRNLDLNKIATFATGGVLLLFISQLTQLTKAMTNITNTANGFMSKFSKKLFGTQTKIKDLAISIGILSASLYVLSRIPWEDLKKGLIGLSLAIGVLVAAYGGIQTINVIASKKLDGIQMAKSAFNLVGFASALAIMAGALKVISSIDNDTIFKSIGVLGSMMGFLIAYQALYTYISLIPGTGKLSVNLTGMAAGILGLIGAIVLLNKITPGELQNGLSKLATIMLVIGAIEAVFGFAARITLGNKLATNMISMAGGILALVGVMKLLSLFNSRDLTKGIGNLFLLGSIFAGLEILFGLAGRLGGGKKFRTHVLETQLSMLSMIGLIKVLSFMTESEIDNGITVLAKMGGIIAGIEVLTALSARIAGGNKTQKILGAMTLTLLSFTGAIALLGSLPTEVIDKGIVILMKMVGLIAAIELITALASRVSTVIDKSGNAVKGGNMFASLIGVVMAVITLTGSLALLSMIDQDSLRKATVSLSIAAVAVGAMSIGLGVMIKALSEMSGNLSNFKGMTKGLLNGLAILGIVVVATVALLGTIKMVSKLLESISWDSIGKFAVGLGVVTTLVLAFSKLSNTGSGSWKTGLSSLIPGFAAMTGVLLGTVGFFKALGYVLPIVDSVSWDSFNKFITGLGLIGIMSVGMVALGAPLAALSTVFLPALGGVLAALAGVGLILTVFVGLSTLMEKVFGDNSNTLVEGIDKLVLVGQGIGRFFGAMAGGFKAEVLVAYGEGLAKFADAVSGIDPSAFNGIKTLSDAILTITNSSIRDGISQFVNSGKNSEEIFGQQIQGLISVFKSIPLEDAVQASNVLTALGPMTSNLKILAEAVQDIPNTGGFLGDFLGNNDVNTFGTQLSGFINIFAASITMEGAQHTSDVLGVLGLMATNLKAFANAAGAIPNTGGFLGDFLGNNDINTFGSMLIGFINVFKTLDVEADVKKASDVLGAMAPMAANLKLFATVAQGIPNTGGLVVGFIGDNDMATFSTEISGLIATFGNLDKDKLVDASNNLLNMSNSMLPALQQFAALSNGLNSTGGLFQGFTGETNLSDFANELKGFVNTLAGVDFTVVQPALQSLSQINASFASVGSEILESAIASFENNKVPFQTVIINFLNDTITTVNEKRDAISTSFAQLFQDAIEKSRTSISDFKKLGADLVIGLSNGIKSERPTAVNAISSVSMSVEEESRRVFRAHSPSKVFTEIGAWLPISLGNGIRRNSSSATLAGITMSEDIENAVRDTLDIHSESDQFNDIGSWVPKSISSGIQNGKEKLINMAKDLGIDTTSATTNAMTNGLANCDSSVTNAITKTLDLLKGNKSIQEVASELGIQTGGAFSGSYANSVNSPASKSAAKSAYTGMAKDAFQIFKEGIDYRKEYNLISIEEEIAEWENFAKKYAVGTDIRMKADKELNRVRFENSKRWIDEEKYYKRLSLLDELAAWERVQKRYKEGHEYRMQAERELFRIKQEIKQAEYQNSLNWIEDQKYYGKLNLSSELAAWKRVQSRYKEFEDDGTKSAERKKSEYEIYRLENEIQTTNLAYEEKLATLEKERTDKRKQLEDDYYNKTKEIKDKLSQDIKSLENEYENAVESRTKTLYSTHGLFDSVEKPEYVSGFDLTNNLEDQVMEFDKWQSSIGALGNRGIDDGLLTELRDMGPKSIAQIKALNRMTQPELDRYVLLWRKKNNEAKMQAVDELSGMKSETSIKIKELTRDADKELDYYNKVWKDSLKELNADNKKQLQLLEKEWLSSLGNISSKGLKIIQQFRLDWFGEIAAMVADTNAQMSQLQKATKVAKAATSAVAIGVSIGAGLKGGIVGTTGAIVGAASSLIGSALTAMKEKAKIHSPSREGMYIGENIGGSVASGLHNLLDSVSKEGLSMGQTALDSISMFVKDIPELLDTDTNALAIQPVLDLTNVKSGISNMNLLLGNSPELGLKTTMQLLPLSDIVNDNTILLNDIRNALQEMTDKEVDLTGVLTVEVTNDKGEIVSIAQTAIKDMLRRESR